MARQSMAQQSLGQRIATIAAEWPHRPAIIPVELTGQSAAGPESLGPAGTVLTWAQLDRRTRRVAAALSRAVAQRHAHTVVWLPAASTVPAVVALLGALRAGLMTAPLDVLSPPADRERQLASVAHEFGDVAAVHELAGPEILEDSGPVLAGPEPAGPGGGWVLMTGGSTGRPRPIRGPGPPLWDPRRGAPLLFQHAGWREGQVQLVLGPLHHAAPFTGLLEGVLSANTVVLAQRYYPELLFELVEEYAVEWMQLTPVHMRMADPLLPVRLAQLRSLRAVLHTAAPCPGETKRAWIDALGAERVFEMYAATESIGATLCSGAEWLARPGTVGRGFLTRIRILDAQHREVPTGQVGGVYLRGIAQPATGARYDGLRGYRSVGDHGRLDGDGYLYLSGRADDLVLIGGENVYLGEVEAALLSLDGVADAAVVSGDDDTYGTRLHAYVVPRTGVSLDAAMLRRHCRRQLPASKTPVTFNVVAELPRNRASKLVRSDPAFARRTGSCPVEPGSTSSADG